MLFKMLNDQKEVRLRDDSVCDLSRDLHLLTYFSQIFCGSRNLRVVTFPCIEGREQGTVVLLHLALCFQS